LTIAIGVSQQSVSNIEEARNKLMKKIKEQFLKFLEFHHKAIKNYSDEAVV
jgi:hypothetical protein